MNLLISSLPCLEKIYLILDHPVAIYIQVMIDYSDFNLGITFDF